jgi:1-acyl-sn-glycerol-3-phosphate acyltransferase
MTPPDDVVLVPLHSVLKTSSGKLRRGAVRELYEQGKLGHGSRALWWQITRLALSGLGRQVSGMMRRISTTLYAAYTWAVFIILAPFVWMSVAVLPQVAWRWRVAGGAVRLLLKLTGNQLHVDGLASLPKEVPCIVVANHASYLDGFVLAASIPGRLSYVAKRELLNSLLLRVPLKRLETLFVERFDLQRSTADAEHVKQAVHAGRSLVFFPEGTFRRMPGLLPFRMGAFVAATQTKAPIVPVTIRGTRSILRANSWFPRRGVLKVTIGAPLSPEGDNWQAAVTLRDASRQAILQHVEEPDLGAEKFM